MELQRAYWEFPAVVGSIPEARVLLAQALRDLPREALDVVLLLADELVTNAVRHGVGPVAVHLAWDGEGVRVEVADQSSERPTLRGLDPEAVSGRGLILVDGLSSGWGVRAEGAGKTVWFSVDLV